MPLVLNMPEFRIYQGPEYAIGFEYGRILSILVDISVQYFVFSQPKLVKKSRKSCPIFAKLLTFILAKVFTKIMSERYFNKAILKWNEKVACL